MSSDAPRVIRAMGEAKQLRTGTPQALAATLTTSSTLGRGTRRAEAGLLIDYSGALSDGSRAASGRSSGSRELHTGAPARAKCPTHSRRALPGDGQVVASDVRWMTRTALEAALRSGAERVSQNKLERHWNNGRCYGLHRSKDKPPPERGFFA
jgi:hypothetical protein